MLYNFNMKSTIQFYISHTTEGYTAAGVEAGIVTQADSLDELMVNLREAVDLHFDGEEVGNFGYARTPAILVNYELTDVVHA